MAVEQLQDGCRLAERACTRERRLVVDGVDEPDPAVGRKGVRRARGGLVDGPREPVRPSLVAEADLHCASVRPAQGAASRPNRGLLPDVPAKGRAGAGLHDRAYFPAPRAAGSTDAARAAPCDDRRMRKWLLRGGLGLLALFVLIQLVPYGRDHNEPAP